MKLQIVLLILGFVCLSAAADDAPALTLSQIKSVTMNPTDVKGCQNDFPNACCYTGETTFTTKYEGTTITSFTVTGNVAGNGCQATSTLNFIPSGASTTATTVAVGFLVTDQAKTLQPYNFLPATQSMTINNVVTNTYYFSIALQNQAAGVANLQTLSFVPTSSSSSSSSSSSLMKISLIGLFALFALLF